MQILIKLRNNKGSGLGVIVFGITLLLILLFSAVNIVNSKVIENGYISLRDAVQSASSGSVIHLLTSKRADAASGATKKQNELMNSADYDIYLQLALGYLINRSETVDKSDETVVQTGDINNFIKLDHQKVVNSTLALLEDATIRRDEIDISETAKYKILMFFIEPYRDEATQKKYFNIIAYGNGDYKRPEGSLPGTPKNIQKALDIRPVDSTIDSSGTRNIENVYEDIEDAISNIVNSNYDMEDGRTFDINLNATGNVKGLISDMETYPHYLIVVKDFALPTIFGGEDGNPGDTTNGGNIIKNVFTSLSGDGKLKTPMCALNTGKVQRQHEEAGWSHR